MAKIESFKFWCQKVLPLVYDDSLSYYELLCKVVKYLNDTINAVNQNTDAVTEMQENITLFEQRVNLTVEALERFVNNYFDNLDVQEEINNKLDEMAEDGTLTALIAPILNDYIAIINETLVSQNQRIGVLESRMDEFSNLPEGSTTGDAELADIRVGFNGITYPNAGDSVRAQSSLVKKELDIVERKLESVNYLIGNEIAYSNMRFVSSGYMNASGEIVEAGQHEVRVMEGSYVNKIIVHLNSTVSYPIIVIKDINNVVKFSVVGDRATLVDKDWHIDFPSGLPLGSKIYVNWWYKNSSILDAINVSYLETDSRITCGVNLYNYRNAVDGFRVDYSNGQVIADATYCYNSIKATAGTTYYVNERAHVCWFDEYGNFISGNVFPNGGSATAPANTKGVTFSVRTAYKTNTQVEVGDSGTVFQPFEYKFIYKDSEITPTSSTIFFTVNVNQSQMIDDVDGATTVDVNSVLKLPNTYRVDGKPTPLIVVFHGSGFYVSDSEWSNSNEFDSMINGFLNAGYAVCDINGYDNTVPLRTWGSERAVFAYRKLIEHVVNNYNVEKEINVFGFSMGGLVALNFMFNNVGVIKSMVLASPVTDLYNQVYSGSAVWKSSMADSYNFDGRSEVTFVDGTPTEAEVELWNNNVAKTVGYNPFERIITHGNVDKLICTLPNIQVWHGTNDSSVNYLYTQRLVNALKNAGNTVQLKLVSGAGHEICYGGNASVSSEYVKWFNRFN